MKLTPWIIGALLIVSFSSCNDDDISEREQLTIEQYFESQNITGLEETTSGIYYEVVEEGEATVSSDDILVANVVISSLDGQLLFSSQSFGPWYANLNEIEFYAGGIENAQEITDGMLEIMLLNKIDGTIAAYIPAELAYGSEGSDVMGARPNEDLFFFVTHVSKRVSIQEYIDKNEIENVQTTATGLQYTIDLEGEGDFPVASDTVKVDYTGTFLNDTQFDSSHDTGREPFEFVIGSNTVIDGWDEGILYFKEGGAGTLLIPYELAYGAAGRYNSNTRLYDIPPYEHLRFDIELIDIQ